MSRKSRERVVFYRTKAREILEKARVSTDADPWWDPDPDLISIERKSLAEQRKGELMYLCVVLQELPMVLLAEFSKEGFLLKHVHREGAETFVEIHPSRRSQCYDLATVGVGLGELESVTVTPLYASS